MGQYYKKSKIGTCENMYYMRLDKAQKLSERGARDDDGISFGEYLSDNATMWRFPFPDEDDMAQAFDALSVERPDKSFTLPCGDVEVLHRDVALPNAHKDGTHNMNIFIPCPYSEEFEKTGLKISRGGTGEQFIYVRYLAIRDGEIKTVFSCSRCEQLQTADREDVQKIKQAAKDYYTANYKPRNNKEETDARYAYAMVILDRIV